MKVNIPTLKRGTKYGPEYVNRLHSGVRQHLGLDFWFLCFTEDARVRKRALAQCERHPQATAVRRRPGTRWIR